MDARPTPSLKPALTFGVYQDGKLVKRETFQQDVIKLGKDPRGHLQLEDEQASLRHAVIEVTSADEITLIDLGFEPGTFVNGKRINKCVIRPGDELLIGSTRVRLESIDAAPVASAAVPSFGDAVTRVASGDSMGDDVAGPMDHGVFASTPPQAMPQQPQIVQAANPFAAAGPASNPFAAAVTAAVANPFATAPKTTLNTQPGTYTYALTRQGPPVAASEIESPSLASIEVTALWESNALKVMHLTPPRDFLIGEETRDAKGKITEAVDYTVPTSMLGGQRVPLVVARGQGAAVVILPKMTGTIEVPGQPTLTVQEIISSGRARASSAVSGAHEFDLPQGAKARLVLDNGLGFQIVAGNAGKTIPIPLFVLPAALIAAFAISVALIGGSLLAAYYARVGMSGDEDAELDRDQLMMMQKLLNAAAEREQEEVQTEQGADNKEGGTGTKAKGEEGKMGKNTAENTGKKYGVQGPQDNPDPHLARQAALKDAQNFGAIGLLAAGLTGDPNAPTAPWGQDTSSGRDPMSAQGNMFGDAIGDSFGNGGLGLNGTGEGGGGTGEGVGLGNFGGLGHGAGNGNGNGIGNGGGGVGRGRQAKAPNIALAGNTQVNGRLPPEVIQRVVRQNFGRFKMCYDTGLRTNPSLGGRVAVKFIIDRTGAVSTAADGGSDLADRNVVSCVVRAFNSLSFPAPEGGIVTVVYPFQFTPGS